MNVNAKMLLALLAVLAVTYVGGWVLLVYGVLALAKNLWDALTPSMSRH